MSRRSLLVTVGVHVVPAVLAGVVWGVVTGLVVAFLSVLAPAIGVGAVVGGNWFRDLSAGRFRDDRRRS